jgi:ankyrin repeat protein
MKTCPLLSSLVCALALFTAACGDDTRADESVEHTAQENARSETMLAQETDTPNEKLFIAIANNDTNALLTAISNGADVNATNNADMIGAQRSPLDEAAFLGHSNAAHMLLQQGADISNAIHIAAKRGHSGLLSLFIEHGATVNSRDANDETPLYHALAEGHNDSVRFLLDAGATVPDRYLLVAIGPGRAETAAILLEHGADINVRDAYGRTAFEIARSEGLDEVLAVLEEYAND